MCPKSVHRELDCLRLPVNSLKRFLTFRFYKSFKQSDRSVRGIDSVQHFIAGSTDQAVYCIQTFHIALTVYDREKFGLCSLQRIVSVRFVSRMKRLIVCPFGIARAASTSI